MERHELVESLRNLVERHVFWYECDHHLVGSSRPSLYFPWFKVAVLAADSAGTEMNRSRRLASVLGDTRKTLHGKIKKFW